MEHLAQDLSVALEESESCGPINFDTTRQWGLRRRTRSAGNLNNFTDVFANNADHSDDSSSSNSETRGAADDKCKMKPPPVVSFHQSDSDDVSQRVANSRAQSLRMKHPIHNIIRGRKNLAGMSYSLESDSLNENSPARPSLRRKRKFKRMSVDEAPIPQCGKRKRAHHLNTVRAYRTQKIKPLHPSVIDKIEKFCQPLLPDTTDCTRMETQYEGDSESSLSWSGGEGHEGDDELTDWAPTMDNNSIGLDAACMAENDNREVRAGCRRLGDERPGFSISTCANERVARFMQDVNKSELRVLLGTDESGAERDKLMQLASLYSLEVWFEAPYAALHKTDRTPCMQPTQRHHIGPSAAHKKIRTTKQDNAIS